MKNTLRNSSQSAIFATAVFAVALIAALLLGHKTDVRAGAGITLGSPSYIVNPTGSGATGGVGVDSATTTETYIHTNDTASTTITGFLSDSRLVSVDVQARASSSAAILSVAAYVSNNAVDWYAINIATTSTQVPSLLSTAETPYQVGLGTTTSNTLRKQMVFQNLIGKYYQIRFGVAGAHTALWATAIPTVGIPN